jgi:hypothetical protein
VARRLGVEPAALDGLQELMLERSHIPEAPWWVVKADDKKKARLNCIHHLLGQMAYQEVTHPTIALPPRQRREDYIRQPVPQNIIVPEVYGARTGRSCRPPAGPAACC